MQNTTVLISGAGVAGTTLAYWLVRHGFRPTVVERAPAPRTGGYKIDVRGAALDVASRMGILDELRRRSTEVRSATFVNDEGRPIATMDGDLFGGRTHGDVELLRGDLNQVLHDAADGVEYLFGDSITSLAEQAGGVDVSFERGAPRTFDLVVGADGLHSTTRRLSFGAEAEFVRDLAHHVAVYSVPNHLGLDREEVTYPMPGKTAIVYSTRHDTGAKAMFLFASAPTDHDLSDPTAQKRHLAETFSDARWEVPQLLSEVGRAPDFYFDSFSQVAMDSWSRGRVALVGDAAYCASPASGQGSSLALVGSYILAGELAAHPGDHNAAYAAYRTRMQGFVEQNQKLAPSNLRGMVMKSGTQLRIQMTMMRALPHLPGRTRIVGRIAEAIHRAATAIEMPAY